MTVIEKLQACFDEPTLWKEVERTQRSAGTRSFVGHVDALYHMQRQTKYMETDLNVSLRRYTSFLRDRSVGF